MEKELIERMKALPDDLLADVVGGYTEEEYATIKQKLNSAVSNNDFAAFSAIVYEYAAVYGKGFFYRVVADFTRIHYLSETRYASLIAGFLLRN